MIVPDVTGGRYRLPKLNLLAEEGRRLEYLTLGNERAHGSDPPIFRGRGYRGPLRQSNDVLPDRRTGHVCATHRRQQDRGAGHCRWRTLRVMQSRSQDWPPALDRVAAEANRPQPTAGAGRVGTRTQNARDSARTRP